MPGIHDFVNAMDDALGLPPTYQGGEDEDQDQEDCCQAEPEDTDAMRAAAEAPQKGKSKGNCRS